MAKELARIETPILQLTAAASLLATVCDLIDNSEDITDTLKAEFGACQLCLREGVDRAFEFKDQLAFAIQRARDLRNFFDAQKAKLEAAEAKFKEQVKDVLTALPDQPYVGSYGKLALQKNPPSVKFDLGDKKLTPELIDMFGIADKYVKLEMIYTLRTKEVADDLKAGVELPWATLEQGCHVRFREG